MTTRRELFHGVDTTRGGVACDRHDECYQSCGSDRGGCDSRMRQDMLNICSKSKESRSVRQVCTEWAEIYYKSHRGFGESAHKDRQREVCECNPSTLGPPRLPVPNCFATHPHRRGLQGDPAQLAGLSARTRPPTVEWVPRYPKRRSL